MGAEMIEEQQVNEDKISPDILNPKKNKEKIRRMETHDAVMLIKNEQYHQSDGEDSFFDKPTKDDTDVLKEANDLGVPDNDDLVS